MTRDRVRFLLECADGLECQVAFEPFGAVHLLRSGDRFTVEVDGDAAGAMEILYRADGITVWAEGDMRVWDRAGNELPT